MYIFGNVYLVPVTSPSSLYCSRKVPSFLLDGLTTASQVLCMIRERKTSMPCVCVLLHILCIHFTDRLYSHTHSGTHLCLMNNSSNTFLCPVVSRNPEIIPILHDVPQDGCTQEDHVSSSWWIFNS
jgi:hypothetical protein